MRWVKQWWRQSDHYDWLMGYVKFRGLSGLVRTMIAAVAIMSTFIPIALMTVPEGPVGLVPRLVTRAATVGLVLAGLIWVAGLPSRRRSTIFAAMLTTCIAAVALSCSDPAVAILVCTTFGVSAAYVAFTHRAIHAAFNFQVAMIVATVEAVRLTTSGRPVLAVCALWLVFVLTVTVPASIQIVVHALGTDLIRADCDPLTFLLNRRGFGIKAQELIHRDRGTSAYLMVTVIDLDGFKLLNDSRGHLFGDRALIAVADILRKQASHDAVIGRSGGDEFLIADTTHRPHQSSAAERLRAAIAATPYAITASVGVATIALSDVDDPAAATIIDDLVMAADLEMYVAKRLGGNASRHADGSHGQTAVRLAE